MYKLIRKLCCRISKKIDESITKLHLGKSLSDNNAYPKICLQASRNPRQFESFRRNKAYNEILEHVSEEQGGEYLDIIKEDAEIYRAVNVFKENDKYGNPRMYSYPAIGAISPTTLRYVKVLADLKSLFGTLDHLGIVEIGVGYGGQCRVINSYFKPRSYCLIDIEPALMLSKRFLDHYLIDSPIIYKTMDKLDQQEYDLLISNYAFTELPRKIQDIYLQKCIIGSKRGYITYNEITPPDFKSYKKEELIKIIPDSKIIDEIPLTHPNNCIIVWGMNR